MHWSDGAAVYHPRKPRNSPLWQLLNEHFHHFVSEYEDRFQKAYGFFRQVISDVVQNFLQCGDLKQGFARVRCPECHHEYLLAFSCRGRWFCPSCHAKKELFRAGVLSMLKREGLIDGSFIAKIMKWRHTSGFSAHNGMRIKRDDEQGKEALAQYIIRSPFSLEKIIYKPETGMIVYRSKMTHGRNKSNFKVFEAAEFIAAITRHIPDKSFQLVRYYGWYSNRSRGDRRKEAGLKTDIPDSTPVPEEIEALDVSAYNPNGYLPKHGVSALKRCGKLILLNVPNVMLR